MVSRLICCFAVIAFCSGSAARGVEIEQVGLAQDSTQSNASKPQTNLTGQWLLTMPEGFEFDAVFEADDRPNHFVLKASGAPLLLGVYQLCDKRLTIVAPRDEKMVGLVWQLTNRNTLVLVDHPETSQFGSDYRGASLGRQKRAAAKASQ